MRVFQRLGNFVVGVVVDVGLLYGCGKGGLASHEIVLPELLLLNLSDDGPGIVGLGLVVARNLWILAGFGLCYRLDIDFNLIWSLGGDGTDTEGQHSSYGGDIHGEKMVDPGEYDRNGARAMKKFLPSYSYGRDWSLSTVFGAEVSLAIRTESRREACIWRGIQFRHQEMWGPDTEPKRRSSRGPQDAYKLRTFP